MNATVPKSEITIKKYANRRLYDTETSQYITLDDLCTYTKQDKRFTVLDAKTGQDLTRQVLTQIILEREVNGYPLLPVDFLRSVIRFYDDKVGMGNVLQSYLDASMKAFTNSEERMRGMVGKTSAEGYSPFKPFEEMTRQNVALFEKTIQMFNPLSMFAGKEEEQVETLRPAATVRRRRR